MLLKNDPYFCIIIIIITSIFFFYIYDSVTMRELPSDTFLWALLQGYKNKKGLILYASSLQESQNLLGDNTSQPCGSRGDVTLGDYLYFDFF